MIKYQIQHDEFIYEIDWNYKLPSSEFSEEYFPDVKESIESLMRLLENLYPKELIAKVLHEGLDAMDYYSSDFALNEP